MRWRRYEEGDEGFSPEDSDITFLDLSRPRWDHDCGPEHGCTFLGTFIRNDGTMHDIWVHDNQQTVIVRHSNDPPDYSSSESCILAHYDVNGELKYVDVSIDRQLKHEKALKALKVLKNFQ